MKKVFFLSLIGLFNLSLKNIGSGTAVLTCKSDSGRTSFYAELQDITGVLEKAEFVVDGTKMNFKTEESNIIFDEKEKVFTMKIIDPKDDKFEYGKYIEFYAIPSTFKILKTKVGGDKYQFKGIIRGTEPRNNKGNFLPTIQLNCVMIYEI
jgi:hypothetical protein